MRKGFNTKKSCGKYPRASKILFTSTNTSSIESSSLFTGTKRHRQDNKDDVKDSYEYYNFKQFDNSNDNKIDFTTNKEDNKENARDIREDKDISVFRDKEDLISTLLAYSVLRALRLN